jgi:hypothetical protein
MMTGPDRSICKSAREHPRSLLEEESEPRRGSLSDRILIARKTGALIFSFQPCHRHVASAPDVDRPPYMAKPPVSRVGVAVGRRRCRATDARVLAKPSVSARMRLTR